MRRRDRFVISGNVINGGDFRGVGDKATRKLDVERRINYQIAGNRDNVRICGANCGEKACVVRAEFLFVQVGDANDDETVERRRNFRANVFETLDLNRIVLPTKKERGAK